MKIHHRFNEEGSAAHDVDGRRQGYADLRSARAAARGDGDGEALCSFLIPSSNIFCSNSNFSNVFFHFLFFRKPFFLIRQFSLQTITNFYNLRDVDLVRAFKLVFSIYLQDLALIQPRMSLSTFAKN